MITVYSKNDCPACKMLKKQLDSNAVAYREINVDTLTDYARDETIAHIKDELGFRSLPVLVADGVEPFSGFNPTLIRKVIAQHT
jgi:glutaredoxin-like protein NrdH